MTRYLQVIDSGSGEVMQTFAPQPAYGLNVTALSAIVGPEYRVAWLDVTT